MSSLWTPGGEVPVDRSRPEPATEAAPPGSEDQIGEQLYADDEELRAHIEELRRRLLAAPAIEVVVEHASGLYELAALHLSQPEPRLEDTRLAIDALAALVEGLGDRLGEAEAPLREAVGQLKLAFVEARGG